MPNIYGISTEDRVLTSSFFAFRRSSVSFLLIVLPISRFFVAGNLSKQASLPHACLDSDVTACHQELSVDSTIWQQHLMQRWRRIDRLTTTPTQNKFETKVLLLILIHLYVSNIRCKWHSMTPLGKFAPLRQWSAPLTSIGQPIHVCHIIFKQTHAHYMAI